ncbi:MAG: hypothetical protein FWC95_06510 [Defluviitaleaceae bacterium]|nr:hypothetical protein [Defluviitaleaceae bacterium]
MEYIRNIFSDFSSVAGFVTLTITIFGVISVLLSNMARYTQCGKYGIPVKAALQMNIADSMNVWITLIGSAGLGIVLPVALLGMDISGWVIVPIITIMGVIAFIFTKSGIRFSIIGEHSSNLIVFFQSSLIFAFSYLRIHGLVSSQSTGIVSYGGGFFSLLLTIIACLGLLFHFTILFIFFKSGLTRMLYGSKGGLMTVDIDGQTHLIIMKNSSYHWILLPCTVKYFSSRKKTFFIDVTRKGRYIVFTRGKFIVRELSSLSEYISHNDSAHVIDAIKYEKLLRMPNAKEIDDAECK